MNVVCNNPVLYVVDYPGFDALEVINKRTGLGAVMRAETAKRFREQLRAAEIKGGEAEDFEACVDLYDALFNQRAVYH